MHYISQHPHSFQKAFLFEKQLPVLVIHHLDPKTKYTVTVKACGFWNNISENSLDADIKTL